MKIRAPDPRLRGITFAIISATFIGALLPKHSLPLLVFRRYVGKDQKRIHKRGILDRGTNYSRKCLKIMGF